MSQFICRQLYMNIWSILYKSRGLHDTINPFDVRWDATETLRPVHFTISPCGNGNANQSTGIDWNQWSPYVAEAQRRSFCTHHRIWCAFFQIDCFEFGELQILWKYVGKYKSIAHHKNICANSWGYRRQSNRLYVLRKLHIPRQFDQSNVTWKENNEIKHD